jgi:hypothetical protein
MKQITPWSVLFPGTEVNVQELLARVSVCYIELDLYDSDGFVLRKVGAPLSRGVDDKARLN